DVPAALAWRPRPGDLLGAQPQNGLDRVAPHRADHFIDGDSGLSDQFDQRKQQLPVGLCELLDTGSRALLFVIDDMVRFLHGGGVLSKDCFWRIDSIEPAPPPPLNLQLRLGHPPSTGSMASVHISRTLAYGRL